MESLLQMVGLNDRLLYDDNVNRTVMGLNLDFERANIMLDDFRKESIRYLSKNLG